MARSEVLTCAARGEVPTGTAVCKLLKEEKAVEVPPQPNNSILSTLVEKVSDLLGEVGDGLVCR